MKGHEIIVQSTRSVRGHEVLVRSSRSRRGHVNIDGIIGMTKGHMIRLLIITEIQGGLESVTIVMNRVILPENVQENGSQGVDPCLHMSITVLCHPGGVVGEI